MKRFLIPTLAVLALVPCGFAIVDVNHNGLSDLWEKQYNNGQLFGASFDPEGDEDGDGWSNAKEAVSGTDPLDGTPAAGLLTPQTTYMPSAWVDTNNDGIADSQMIERVEIKWPSIIGKQYQLSGSPDLMPETWLDVDEPRMGTGGEIGLVIPLAQPDGSVPEHLFWRVAVKDVDTDGDGMTNAEEHQSGSSSFLADSNDDGIDDAEAAAMGLNPAGNTADANGDGVPDNHYYSVEFEFEYERHMKLAPPTRFFFDHQVIKELDATRADLNARYLTAELGEDYSVSDSYRYESIPDGHNVEKKTVLNNGGTLTDGTVITTENGAHWAEWAREHEKNPDLGLNEYYCPTGGGFVDSGVNTTITNESTFATRTTITTTQWELRKDTGPFAYTVLQQGNESISNTLWHKLSDPLSYSDFWHDHVETTQVEGWPTQTTLPLHLSLMKFYGAMTWDPEAVRDSFKKGDAGVYNYISLQQANGDFGQRDRLKSLRWRWIRFNPLNPYEPDHAAPPASYKQNIRLLVRQSDSVWSSQENKTTSEEIVEIECLGSQGGTGWQEVPMELFNKYLPDDPPRLNEVGFNGKFETTEAIISNIPAEVISRDRMIAGRLAVPPGWEDEFEIQFVNTTTGEDLGTYGHLLDRDYGPYKDYSDSYMFGTWEQQTYEAGNLDPRIRTQNVIFCDGNDPAIESFYGNQIEFYTVFGALGNIEIRLIHNGTQVGVIKRALTADAAFGGVIDHVNELVSPPPVIAAAATAGEAPLPAAPAAGFIHPLARRALVPFFNGYGAWMAAQTDVDALVIGLLDGIKQGALDDWQLIQWVQAQSIQLQYALPAMLIMQTQRWMQDPYTRALEAANAIRNAVQNGLIKPMQALGGALGDMAGNFSSWERFKEFNWKVHQGLLLGQVVAVQIITDSAAVILQGLGDWYVDFCERMYEGAELGVFQSVSMGDLPAWRQDLRTFYRTFGYSFGYLSEQLLLGHGVAALGKGMANVGPKIALSALPKVKSLGVRVLPFLNKRWAARVITTADREAAEQAIRAAQTARSDAHAVLQSDGAKPVADWLDEAISRQTGSVNGKLIAEEIGNSPKIMQAMRNGTSIFLDRLALMEKLLGTKLDDVVAGNFTKLYEKKLLSNPSTGADIFEDFLVAVHTQYLSGQRPILDQLTGNAASLDRLEVFFKGPPPFSPWKAGFETADSFGDSSRGLLIQLYEAVHGKYQGWTNLDILQDGKVVRAAGVDLVNPAAAGHYVQITTTAASNPDWVAKLDASAAAAKARGGTKLTFDVFWLENNGRPTASLDGLEAVKSQISSDRQIEIEILDTASKFSHWEP